MPIFPFDYYYIHSPYTDTKSCCVTVVFQTKCTAYFERKARQIYTPPSPMEGWPYHHPTQPTTHAPRHSARSSWSRTHHLRPGRASRNLFQPPVHNGRVGGLVQGEGRVRSLRSYARGDGCPQKDLVFILLQKFKRGETCAFLFCCSGHFVRT